MRLCRVLVCVHDDEVREGGVISGVDVSEVFEVLEGVFGVIGLLGGCQGLCVGSSMAIQQARQEVFVLAAERPRTFGEEGATTEN